MEQTKLSLSAQEIQLVTDPGWILTKNAILEKMRNTLDTVYRFQQERLLAQPGSLPAQLLQHHGKISRGENYLGLPYLVLDYPRCFERQHIFAIRSFFWWGCFFSTTLHLSGKWQALYAQRLCGSFAMLRQNDFGICTDADEWNHDLRKGSFISCRSLATDEFCSMLRERPFLKIAAFTSIERLASSAEIWKEQFEILLHALR